METAGSFRPHITAQVVLRPACVHQISVAAMSNDLIDLPARDSVNEAFMFQVGVVQIVWSGSGLADLVQAPHTAPAPHG